MNKQQDDLAAIFWFRLEISVVWRLFELHWCEYTLLWCEYAYIDFDSSCQSVADNGDGTMQGSIDYILNQHWAIIYEFFKQINEIFTLKSLAIFNYFYYVYLSTLTSNFVAITNHHEHFSEYKMNRLRSVGNCFLSYGKAASLSMHEEW